MQQKFFDSTVPKFLLVGIVNTLIGCGIMFFLYNVFHCTYWVSSAANYIVGGIVSFFLNKYFTFQNQSRSGLQVCKFMLTVGVCYLLAYHLAKSLVVQVFINQSISVQENIAMIIGMGFYTGFNYLGQRFFVFRKKFSS